MKKTQLKVKLLGTTFSIQSTENQEYLEQIMAFYRSKIDEITTKISQADPLKLAIIAGLNIVDELFKERNRQARAATQDAGASGNLINASELDQITARMINKINSTLQDAAED